MDNKTRWLFDLESDTVEHVYLKAGGVEYPSVKTETAEHLCSGSQCRGVPAPSAIRWHTSRPRVRKAAKWFLLIVSLGVIALSLFMLLAALPALALLALVAFIFAVAKNSGRTYRPRRQRRTDWGF